MRNLRPESASTVVADSARRRSTMIKVGCALAAGVLIPAGVVSANASAAPTTVAHDGFGRNVVSGLGRADLGGAYTVFGSSAAKVSVASGSAHVKGLGRGQSFGAYLPSTSAQDSDSQISLRIPALSSSRVGLYVGLESRRQSNGAAYRAKVSVGLGGHLSVALSRVGAKGAETTLASAAVPFVMTANQTVNIETAVSGANPTKVAARVWRAGTAAPGWQLTSVDATAAQVRAAGHVGVWSYLSPSGAATEFFVSNYNAATVVAAAAPAPTPPAPTPPAPTPPAPTAPAPTPPAPAAVTAGAGSAAVGSTSYPIPAGAIFVSPSGSDSAAGSLAAPLRTVQGRSDDPVLPARSSLVRREQPGQRLGQVGLGLGPQWLDQPVRSLGELQQGLQRPELHSARLPSGRLPRPGIHRRRTCQSGRRGLRGGRRSIRDRLRQEDDHSRQRPHQPPDPFQ
jgi:hypothetical protein